MTDDRNDDFEMDAPQPESGEGFVVDLQGYEGPIDMLLAMARDQKVDLIHISILELAEQYLAFVAAARQRNLELAADYLVMAAWLAYLKSRLLLPDLEGDDEPTGAEMAAALQFQLQRLEAMQNIGARLMARPRLGQEFFARGEPESLVAGEKTVFEVTLYDLLRAYGDQRSRAKIDTLHIEPFKLYTVDDALHRIQKLLGSTPDWANLESFLPDAYHQGQLDRIVHRSALAATFTASLEMAREGKVRLRQEGTFGPIFLRSGPGAERGAERNGDDDRAPDRDKA